ncbi:MAG: ribulose-phosphate 3-epimerase [Dehalococcoidia bacterium]|nr:ribulose-phosphate 3-epimerase [Dehalococcoidia bacterium]
MIKISPSILSADFCRLGEQIVEAERAGADYIHIDVMDGHFVSNITIGPPVVQAIRAVTSLPLDVHLMIENPDRYVKQFVDAGADILTVHVEACDHLHGVVHNIKKLGIKVGVSLNPATSLASIEEILPDLDLVLVMTVNPGFGGQSFIASVVGKIARLRQMLDERGLAAELEIDGGVGDQTAPLVVKAGANVLVAGSAVFNKKESVASAIARIRASVEGL